MNGPALLLAGPYWEAEVFQDLLYLHGHSVELCPDFFLSLPLALFPRSPAAKSPLLFHGFL